MADAARAGNDTDFDAGVAAVRSFLRREAAERVRAIAERKARLRALLPELSARLRAAGARAAWVFGSLAERPGWSAPHPTSDLDLAVAGLDIDSYLEIERSLRMMSGAEPVDLVRLEEVPAGLRTRIVEDGEPLP